MRGRASEVYCAKTGTVTVFRDTRRFTLLTCVMSPHDGMSYVRLSVHKSLTMRINNYQLGTRYNLYEKLQGSNFYFKRTHYHGKSSSNGKANSIVPTSVAITASAVLSLLLERDGSRTLADSGTTESNCKEMNDRREYGIFMRNIRRVLNVVPASAELSCSNRTYTPMCEERINDKAQSRKA